MNIIIKPSHLADKKFDAIINNKKTIPFGQKGASDFTKNKNEDQKNRYINRHKKGRIGMIHQPRDSTLKIFFGIKRH